MQFTSTICLKEALGKQQFTQIESSFVRQFGLSLETCDSSGRPIRSLCSSDCMPEFCRQLRWSKVGNRRCRHQRLRCMQTAAQTGRPAVTICHAGLILACVPVMDGPSLLGGLFFGRCLDESYGDSTLTDVQNRLRGLQIYEYELDLMLAQLPIFAFRQMHMAAEFLYILLYQTINLNPLIFNQSLQQSESHHATQTRPFRVCQNILPVRLVAAIKTYDHPAITEIRNHLPESVPSENPNCRKTLFIERFAALTCAAVKTGIPIEPLLHLNIDCIHKALSVCTRDDIDKWNRRMLDEFIETVRRLQDNGKLSKLSPAIDLMHICFDQPLKLDEIAGVTGLSVSRLGHLFVEQIGVTPIDYLNGIRIAHVKHRLRTTEDTITCIAYDTGFMDPGYLTRVFKKYTGRTPAQYRIQNRSK